MGNLEESKPPRGGEKSLQAGERAWDGVVMAVIERGAGGCPGNAAEGGRAVALRKRKDVGGRALSGAAVDGGRGRAWRGRRLRRGAWRSVARRGGK